MNGSVVRIPPRNRQIAARLHEAATLLEQQGASVFRVRAYRRAADAVASHARDVADEVHERGATALEELPGVGRGIAAAILELLATGRWMQLERLRGAAEPEDVLATIPGIGPSLARRIHVALNVDSLEAVEVAAYDGRLAAMPGLGPKRLAAIRDGIAERLRRIPRLPGATLPDRPTVAEILDVDAAYREAAERGTLPTLSPRRFNPRHEPWLPVLHESRGDWHFTVLYSNTALAHELGRTRDWVVVYYHDHDHDHAERQCTVVTEVRGELRGRRVLRGREAECREHYARRPAAVRAVVAASTPEVPP